MQKELHEKFGAEDENRTVRLFYKEVRFPSPSTRFSL